MRPSNRLTRYVLSELNGPTLLGLLLYTFVLLMNHFFVVAEKALAKNLGLDLTLRLFLTGIPNLLVLSIPMSVLLGSLIGMGRISADHEWVALQGAGQGPSRLLRPVLLHGLFWSLVSLGVYGWVVPQANFAMRNLRGELLFASNLASDLKPRVFYTNLPNAVLFVDDIRAGSQGRLEGVLLIRVDPRDQNTVIFLAKSGDLAPAPDRSGDLLLDLYDGVVHSYNEEPLDGDDYYYYSPHFDSITERIEGRAYLQGLLEPPEKVVQDFDPPELIREYRSARAALEAAIVAQDAAVAAGHRPNKSKLFLVNARRDRAIIEIHQRLALPFASLFFAILSLPLGITRVRSGKGAGFALSLLVILIYWASFTFARDQALLGRFPAALGPWAGNLVILPWALWGYWRLHRPPSSWPGLIPWLFITSGRLLRALRELLTVRRRRSAGNGAENGATPVEEALEDLSGTPSRFVRRLDQYVGLYYLRVLIFAMASAYLIYALVETKALTDGLLRTGEPFTLMLRYYPYFVPGVAYIVLPISCLIAAIVTFTLLSRTGEITAIKSSGVSVRRATLSVVVLTALLCGLLFYVQDRIAPGTTRKAQAIRDRITGSAPRTYGATAVGQWGFAPQGRHLYHYRVYHADREEFQGISVFTIDRKTPRILDHRFAKRAVWTGAQWSLQDGWYRSFAAGGTPGTVGAREDFVNARIDPLDSPAQLTSKNRRRRSLNDVSEQMDTTELRSEIGNLERRGYDTTDLQVALHGKVAHSFTPFVMVLLGLPFAFKIGRKGSLYGIGVAFLLVLVYWAVLAIFNALGLETLLDPWVAAWAPNVLFGLLGSYLMLYVRT